MLPRETPSTRKVTATTFVPAVGLGTAVRTTILLTMAGAVSVIEDVVVPVPVPVPVPLLLPELVLVPAPLLLLLELVPVVPAPLLLLLELVPVVPAPLLLLLELVLVPAPLLLLLELVLVPVPVVIVPAPEEVALVVLVAAVVPLVMSLPQADSVTDSVAMTLTAVCLEMNPLKVSYITVSPFKQ